MSPIYIDIPEQLFNYNTGKPFETCHNCKESLANRDHLIEKIYKHNTQLKKSEILFEYAMCFNCMQGFQGEISKESMQNLQLYFTKYQEPLQNKVEGLLEQNIYQYEKWVETCSFSGRSVSDLSEFHVSAIVKNGKIELGQTPIVISADVIEGLQDELSRETKEYFDGIKDNLIDLPSEVKDLINGPTIGIF